MMCGLSLTNTCNRFSSMTTRTCPESESDREPSLPGLPPVRKTAGMVRGDGLYLMHPTRARQSRYTTIVNQHGKSKDRGRVVSAAGTI